MRIGPAAPEAGMAPPIHPSPSVTSGRLGPSRWYYALAALVLVAGIASWVLLLVGGLGSFADSLTQVVVPGKHDIALAEPGVYTVFYEHESVVGGRVYATGERLPGLQVTLASRATGAPVVLSRASTSARYSLGGRSGVSLLEFRIEQAGSFELSAWYPGPDGGPEVVLAVGRGFTTRLLGTILGSLGIFFGSAAAAVAIAAVTFVKRRKALRGLAGAPA